MKRRTFIQYGMLGSAGVFATSDWITPQDSVASESLPLTNQRHYSWIFLYWMPYDNDLGRFGQPIVQMLTKGVQTEQLLVVVQADLWGEKNLFRTLIEKGRVTTQPVATTNSASEANFAAYLHWAKSNFRADRWAIIILGHGGRLDQISPDENTGTTPQSQWMNLQKLSDVVTAFNQDINDQVELFFFQNCHKGTLEAHYTCQRAAKYTLSSQKLLGAPNSYYQAMLQFLGQNLAMNGGQLAEKIIEFEGRDMYNSYTITANQAFQTLPSKFNPLIDDVVQARIKLTDLRLLKPYRYMNEQYVDLNLFLETLAHSSQSVQKSCETVIDFLKTFVIYKYQQNPRKLNPNLAGLGLFLPRNRQELAKYLYWPVFSDLKLVKLLETVWFRT